jgi:hypothetical protein
MSTKRPKRLFKSRPSATSAALAPELQRFIDRATVGHPALRHALLEATAVLSSPAAAAVFEWAPSSARGELLVCWQQAVHDLADGKGCDVCPAVARAVRLITVWPGGDFRGVEVPDHPRATLAAWLLLCPQCDRKSDRKLTRSALDKLAGVQSTHGPGPYRVPMLVGARVGAVGHLSPGHALEECRSCAQPIWIDRAEVDRLGETIGLMFLCRGCADRDLAAGRLQSAPMPFAFL